MEALFVLAGFGLGVLVTFCLHERSGCGEAHQIIER